MRRMSLIWLIVAPILFGVLIYVLVLSSVLGAIIGGLLLANAIYVMALPPQRPVTFEKRRHRRRPRYADSLERDRWAGD